MISVRRVTASRIEEIGSESKLGFCSQIPVSSSILYFVAVLVLVPIVLSGLIAVPLQLIGLQQKTVTILSLILGVMVGFAIIVRDWITDPGRACRSSIDGMSEADIDSRSLDRIEVQNAEKAWMVLELEDFGPGYVVETAEEEVFYFAGQLLIDNEGNCRSPTTHMSIDVGCKSKDLINIEFSGATVRVIGNVFVSLLPFDPTVGFHLLSKAELYKAIIDGRGSQ